MLCAIEPYEEEMVDTGMRVDDPDEKRMGWTT